MLRAIIFVVNLSLTTYQSYNSLAIDGSREYARYALAYPVAQTILVVI
jgi:hypothetical protein